MPLELGLRWKEDGDGIWSFSLSSTDRSVARRSDVGLCVALPAEFRVECAMRGLVKYEFGDETVGVGVNRACGDGNDWGCERGDSLRTASRTGSKMGILSD